MNILYVADPNSIHDLKWISYFSQLKNYKCYLLVRKSHLMDESSAAKLSAQASIEILGGIDDFSVSKPWITVPLFFRLKKIIGARSIDIVHIMYAEPNALLVLLLGTKLGKLLTTRGSDVLLTIPVFFERDTVLKRVVSFAYRRAFNKFNFITCTSRTQENRIFRILGKRNNKVRLVRTGVDVSIANKRHSLNHKLLDKKIVFMPRNMKPIYNHELCLKAIEYLPQFVKESYQFVFINSDSDDKEYISYINSLMLESSGLISFLPSLSQEEMFAIYSQSDLVVITTTSDGSPVTAMESMLFRVPLILPPLDYDQEIFGGINKYKAWTPESLSSTMENVLLDSNKSQLDFNKDIISELCDREKEMGKIMRIYDELAISF